MKVCVWINPYIGQKAAAFQECVKKKAISSKDKHGEVWQWDLWQAGQGIIDFTNPEARHWYKERLKELIEIGVDSFKTDFGERIPTDVNYHDGSDPQKMHNYYAYLYNEVVFELLAELRPDEAVVFARSASVGSQKFPVHWGGDNLSEYPSMAESLRVDSHLCYPALASGAMTLADLKRMRQRIFINVGHNSAYYLLIVATMVILNIEYRGTLGRSCVSQPTIFKIKNRLMPYIYEQAVEAAQTGIPMMRPVMLEFPEDYTTHTIDKQYMFGERLLIAPIFNEQRKGHFYLPEGRWTNYLDNHVYEEQQWYTQTYDYFHLPLMVRPNSLIIEGSVDTTLHTIIRKDLTVHVFELTETVTQQVVDQQGLPVGTITVIPEDDSYLVKIERVITCSSRA